VCRALFAECDRHSATPSIPVVHTTSNKDDFHTRKL
jgi:hypothetical protein